MHAHTALDDVRAYLAPLFVADFSCFEHVQLLPKAAAAKAAAAQEALLAMRDAAASLLVSSREAHVCLARRRCA
eukprot:CAMPEP_0119352808 /NCGR_PEP_ID=MMETSP1334-20130426/2018_1 /TAXON_ID=127549 /ORGANISM="Calcidiscus leptoporus, Strain RCC1130" /LENGTH=73 /DNA_ID=CAMNT_0007365927 /DNA_START=197 /DNA_END=420 /DNA_ORIENTATION=-